jgi:hypothetical protein
MNNSKWEKPEFKGLTLLGPWRECNAMTMAQKIGTVVMEEADLCLELGCQPEALDEHLSEYFVEHDIHAVMSGKEGSAERTLSVVREHDRVQWDGFTSKPKGVRPLHFQVRLFSPNDRADSKWRERLSRAEAEVPARPPFTAAGFSVYGALEYGGPGGCH